MIHDNAKRSESNYGEELAYIQFLVIDIDEHLVITTKVKKHDN